MRKNIKLFILIIICSFLCANKVKAFENYPAGTIIKNSSDSDCGIATNCKVLNNENILIIQAKIYYVNSINFSNVGKAVYFVNPAADKYLKDNLESSDYSEIEKNLIKINNYTGDNRYNNAITYIISNYIDNTTNGENLLKKMVGFNDEDYKSILINDVDQSLNKGYRIFLEPAYIYSNIYNKKNTAIISAKGLASLLNPTSTDFNSKLGNTLYNQTVKVFESGSVSNVNGYLVGEKENSCKNYNNRTLSDYLVRCLYKTVSIDNYVFKNGSYSCYGRNVTATNGGLTCSNWDKNNEETYKENYTQSNDSSKCSSFDKRSNTNYYGKYIELTNVGTCRLYCNETLYLSFPGNISIPKQKGTYFAWPTSTEGGKYNLSVKSTLNCTILDLGGQQTTGGITIRTCSSGTKQNPENPDNCIEKNGIDKKCPIGYVDKGNVCYKEVTRGTKAKTTKTTDERVCDTLNNWQNNPGGSGNKACRKKVADAECDTGYEPNPNGTGDKACIKKITEYSSRTCYGTVFVDKSKFIIGNDGVSCIAGTGNYPSCVGLNGISSSQFTYYNDTRTCATTYGKSKTCDTANGYGWFSDSNLQGCIKTISFSVNCPDGYTKIQDGSGWTCFKEVDLQKPEGGTTSNCNNNTKTCDHYISGWCPEGYDYNSNTGKCNRNATVCKWNAWVYAYDPSPSSSPNCYYTNRYGKKVFSKSKCQKSGDACYTAHPSSTLFGTVYVGAANDFCHTTSSHDHDARNTCLPGCYYRQTVNSCSNTKKTVDVECPSGYSPINTGSGSPTCHNSNAPMTCPEGYTSENRNDGKCVTFTSPNSCPEGYMQWGDDACLSLDEEGPNYCPSGYTDAGRTDNMCYAYSYASCPVGYIADVNDGKCYAYSDSYCDNASGWYNNNSSDNNKKCKKEYFEYAPKKCSSGTKDGDSCYNYQSKTACPGGYNKSGSSCLTNVDPYCGDQNNSNTLYTTDKYCCNSGNSTTNKPYGEKCINPLDTKLKECPNNDYYTPDKNNNIEKCYLIKDKIDKLECPDGYTSNENICINGCTALSKEKFISKIKEKFEQKEAYQKVELKLKVDGSTKSIDEKLKVYNTKTELKSRTDKDGQLKSFTIEGSYQLKMRENINRYYNRLTDMVDESPKANYFDRGEGVISISKNTKIFGSFNQIQDYEMKLSGFKNIGVANENDTYNDNFENINYVCKYRLTDKNECKCPEGTKNAGDSVYNLEAYIKLENPKQMASNIDVTTSCVELQKDYCDYEPKEEYCKKDNGETINITNCIKSKNTTYEEAFNICEKENCNSNNNYCTKNCKYTDKIVNHTVYTIQKCNNSEICGFYLHCISDNGEEKETSQSYLNLLSQKLNTTNIVLSLRNNSIDTYEIETQIRNLDSKICGIQANPKIVYRVIDLNNPFPGKNGTNRDAGYNWSSNKIINQQITNNRGIIGDSIYSKPPILTITLTPNVIDKIREYNDNRTYNDFDLKCSENNTAGCISDFIHGSSDSSLKSMGILNGIENCTSLSSNSSLSLFDACYNANN